MTNPETLQELARQVRRDTLAILDAAEPDWLLFAPVGTSNHIIWHAGHAVWLGDLLCEQLLGGGGYLPADWSVRFGMKCRPPSQTRDWPSRDQMRMLLEAQITRILELLSEASDDQLTEIADPTLGPATITDRIIHGFHDEAKHCGEMHLLLKLARAVQT